MAEFNPFLPPSNIPDWTNAPGRLIDGSGVGEIFGKLALSVGTQAGDANKKRIEGNIYDGAEAAAEEGRTGALAEAAGIPPDLARSMGKADLWRKAFDSGRYSETSFYNKMDVWAKEVKSKYPGYKDVIDQQTQRVMGRTPANLELDSVRSQYAAQQTEMSKAASDKQTFLEKNKGVLTPEEEVEFLTSDNPEIVSRLKTKGMLLSSDRARFDYEMKQLEGDAKAGVLQAGPAASQLASNIERQVYLGAVGKGGGTLQSLRSEINRMREGGFTPEETEAANALIQGAIASVDQAWVAGTTTPGENGKSLSDYFANDPTAWNAQKAKIEAIKTDLGGLLTGKAGVFEWNATAQSALTNTRMEKLRDTLGADFVDGMKAIEGLVGSENMNTIYQNISQSEGKDPVADYMTGLIVGKALKTGDVGSAINEAAKNVDPAYRAQANQSARGAIEALYKTAYDDKLPVEARKMALTTILTDKDHTFFRGLKDTPDNTGLSSREKAYKRLLDPELAATAKTLGLEKEYTERLKSYGVTLASTNVEQANATNVATKFADIAFNPNTMRYEMTLKGVKDQNKVATYLRARKTGNGHKAWSEMPSEIPFADLDAIAAGADSIQKLNMITEGLVLALKSEKPGISNEDLGKEIQNYLSGLNASYEKASPWYTKAYEAIKDNSIFSGGLEKGKQQNQKDLSGEDFGVVPEGGTDFSVQEDSLSSLGDDDAASILSFVSKAEGADFNTLFGGSKVILEEKTVAEVQQLQRAHGKKTGSSATGAYQVMRKTLSDLIDQGVVDPDEPFTEDVQNRIGMALLKRRGYDDWKAGKMTTSQFANKLSQEWASLPGANGRSAYEGTMGNKATRSRDELIRMLDGIAA